MQVYSCLFMFAMFANHSVCMHDIFRNRKILEFTISRYTIFANKEKHSWTVHAFYTFPNTEQFWQIKNLGKLFLLSGQDTLNAKVIGKSDAYVQQLVLKTVSTTVHIIFPPIYYFVIFIFSFDFLLVYVSLL